MGRTMMRAIPAVQPQPLAPLVIRLVMAGVVYCSMSYIANNPPNLLAASCLEAESGFPCGGSLWSKAVHVAAHLHLGPSASPPVLVTQLSMAAALLLGLSDLLKAWPRKRPLLPGTPTTVGSPLRIAVSLAVRLGAPLYQILYILITRSASRQCFALGQHSPGVIYMYTLEKARNTLLGRAITSSSACALPPRMHLWVGIVEIVLILVATAQTLETLPGPATCIQLAAYSVLMYLIPLCTAWICQRTHHHHRHPEQQQPPSALLTTSSKQQQGSSSGSGHDVPAGAAAKDGGQQKGASPGASPSLSSTVTDAIAGSLAGRAAQPPSGPNLSGKQVDRFSAEEDKQHCCCHQHHTQRLGQEQEQQVVQGQRHGRARNQYGSSVTSTQAAAPAVPLSFDLAALLPVAAATQGRPSTLYRSPLTHLCMSIKVHRPVSRSHAETAAALQQDLPTYLSASLPDQLAQVSSAWVRGCVHMFAWAAYLNRQLPQRAGGLSTLDQGMPCLDPESSLQVPEVHLSDAAIASLQQYLAEAAGAAGAQGAVDVQVGMDQPSVVRYNLDGRADIGTPAHHTAHGRVTLHSLDPPCIILPYPLIDETSSSDMPPTTATAQLHLSSQHTQRVRVLLLVVATGAVLVDAEHEIQEGPTAVQVEVPLAQISCSTQCPAALRVVVSSPSAHPSGVSQPPRPTRLHATATLLAAPAPLAAELSAVFSGMQQDGRGAGLSAQDMWADHWQPLINDIALCLPCAPGAHAAATWQAASQQEGAARVAQQQVAQNLIKFCSAHGLIGWRSYLEGICAPQTQLLAGVSVRQHQRPAAAAAAPAGSEGHDDPPTAVPAEAPGPTPDDPPPAAPETSEPFPEPHKGKQVGLETSPSGVTTSSGETGETRTSSTTISGSYSSMPVPPPPPRPLYSRHALSRGAQTPPPPFNSRPAAASLAASYGGAWPLRLVVSGFPDAGDEAAWWHEWLHSAARLQTYDRFSLGLQGVIWSAGSARDWSSAHYFVAVQLSTTAVWQGALVKCIVKSCSRRARAHTFLWAAVADTLVVALLSSGITGHPYQSVAHLVPSALRYACTAVARCMQLQGTLVEWIPIGAALCLNGIIIRLGVGRPALPVILAMLATWLVTSCLAAVFEIRQRVDFLNQRLLSAAAAPGRQQQHQDSAGKADAKELAKGASHST